jgi:hypothetical protein
MMSPGKTISIRDIGEVHDFPADEVEALVRLGIAEIVESHPHKDEDHSDKPTRKVRGHK